MAVKNKIRKKPKPKKEKPAEIFPLGKKDLQESERIKKIKIKVLGIGGGAGNIVSEIAARLKKASFFIIDTDNKSLKKISKNAEFLQFGQNITFGSGTGMNPELGERAAKDSQERIKKILQGADLCIFVAALGGGTGSGAAPIFAEISKNLGNLNYGIFTLPFEFEGRKRLEIAKNSLEKLRQNLNVFTLIENERIFKIIDRKIPFKTALSQINKILAEALEGLIEIIYQPGLINIDFADVKTIFKGEGNLAYLNTIESSGENRVKEALAKILNYTLYSYDIRGAKGILYDISGDKNLGLAEVGEISRSISELAEKGARIIFGVSEDNKHCGKIKVFLLATGCKSALLEKLFPTEPRVFSKDITPKIPFQKKAQKKIQKVSPNNESLSNGVKIIKEEKKVEPKQENISQIRKNALQLKKESEEAEKEMLEKEKFWEIPTFLRRKNPQ